MINRYKAVQASTCSAGSLLLLLYDKIIAEIQKAQRDPDKLSGCLMKAELGVLELERTLNFKPLPELAESLHNLYLHVLLVLGEAVRDQDASQLPRIEHLLSELRAAFAYANQANQAAQGTPPLEERAV